MTDDNGQDEGKRVFVRITNDMIWQELQGIRTTLNIISDYEQTKKRVSKLELRFYGLLAGLVSALGIIAYTVRIGGR